MFISNNPSSFQLWSKENVLKRQSVSKYYENDCLQNLLFRLSLLTPKFAKKKSYLGQNLLYISKKRPKTNLKCF